ncbi:MAG: hypothetical protein ACP5JR_04090 [Thermoplasmata archaeon]
MVIDKKIKTKMSNWNDVMFQILCHLADIVRQFGAFHDDEMKKRTMHTKHGCG